MCLAVPAKILVREADQARVDYGGLELDVDVSLVPEAQVGDYVIIHVGIALSMMTEIDALETLKTHHEFLALSELGIKS